MKDETLFSLEITLEKIQSKAFGTATLSYEIK
jgi:hypothetical protein